MYNGLDIDERHLVLAAHAAAPHNPTKLARLIGAFARARLRAVSIPATIRTLDTVARDLGVRLDRDAADRAIAWAGETAGHIVTLFDPAYPEMLTHIAAPPPVLFVAGSSDVLNAPQLAIVGTRRPSHYAREFAGRLAAAVAARGIVVTSGLARGIDGEAHRGALSGAGRTIAVLGCGIDRVYPERHRKLAADIVAAGALVSEFPLGLPPRPYHFPRRNRIISGLCRATVVIEAAVQSGTMTTARHALDQGREVFALPGSVNNPNAAGCHQLLKDGAALVENENDILALFPEFDTSEFEPARATDNKASVANMAAVTLDDRERTVLEACAYEAASFDVIVCRTGLTPTEVSSLLSALEVRGLIRSFAGNTYLKTGV